MHNTDHSQSLTDFRQTETETLNRLNQTGEAEILTVNGEARAVLLSLAAYEKLSREAELSRDIHTISQARRELEQGQGQDADSFFQGVRAQLLAMQRDDKSAE